MPDSEILDPTEEFARYRRTVLDSVVVPGPAAVRRTVRLRRRRRWAALVAAALALLTGPTLGYVALHRPEPRPGPVLPTPDATGTPTPTAPTTPTGGPPPTGAGPTATPPDGRISRGELLATPVTLPTWPTGAACPTAGVRLTADGQEGRNALLALAHGDVDGDGAQETVVLVQCVFGTHGWQQVVAFDRGTAGRIVTVGRVVVSARERPQWLIGVQVRGDGVVRVQVGDIYPGGGWAGEWSQRQWRGYRWDGGSFRQVSGPTGFPTNPHEVNLVVTATELVLGVAPDGSRTGSTTVRVRNTGTAPARSVALRFDLPAALRPDGDGWAACRSAPGTTGGPVRCEVAGLAPGAEIRLVLGLRVAGDDPPGAGTAELTASALDADHRVVAEVVEYDNVTPLRYR
ncbi:hypothetical protein TPA0907_61570 [Micromonospora humidisoli]|uniref:hypothetical protein n=1 Tax=Micromonospora sp. AKA109 TaxID=2733865 RepID=UPI0022C37CDF|nr:hypothetical protein [Micromonospora sp. AKA109]GHJ11790.1 hypothetical protein TPA0907_61570 [Micromonospora sp. AKA109]